MDKHRQPDLTRQRILEASYAEIHRHGFQAASVAGILADTGLTKGALYHHFPSKKDLGLAVINEMVRVQLDDWMFRPLRTSRQPVQALLDLIDAKGKADDPAMVNLGCPLNNLTQEMSHLDADFRAALSGIMREWQDAVKDVLLRAQGAGVVRADVDCYAAALFIVAAWEGCTGTAKNAQSAQLFRACMTQLRAYVASLLCEAT
jgi:TetR/AcrR family transcriptional regulator, transcriptional repressor for nem operon